MSHPAKRQALIKARDGRGSKPAKRVVPKVTCERCQRDVYAAPDGTPRSHLRPSTPDDRNFDPRVPTMVDCQE